MSAILTAIGILGGLGLVFGLILAVASKVFYVEVDPRLEQLNECLPGANCGGCGYAGCGGYAEAVLKGEAPVGKCASGGDECAQAMGAIMGIKAEKMTRRVAMVHCSGYQYTDEDGNEVGLKHKGNYEGIMDCAAAAKIAGNGPTVCKFGCLGYGNCTRVCNYDAIHIDHGVARVDFEKCVGCLACAAACPRQIIHPVEYGKHTVISCSSHAKGTYTARGCTIGCIGCGLCKKVCPNGAISLDKNLAVIDYSKCTNCGTCASVCPKRMIRDASEHVGPKKEKAAAK